MKKTTYTLTVEYNNGDALSRGGLTQTKCYQILKRHEDNYWMLSQGVGTGLGLAIVRWKIESGWVSALDEVITD